MTTVSQGQKALILFRGLQCAGEGECKDRVGAGWCLQRAVSLGFPEPPPPARGVGQLREVMHRGLPAGPRPWGRGQTAPSFWSPGRQDQAGAGMGGRETPGGQGLPVGASVLLCRSRFRGDLPGHYAHASSGVCLERRLGPDPTPWGLVCHVFPGGGEGHRNRLAVVLTEGSGQEQHHGRQGAWGWGR